MAKSIRSPFHTGMNFRVAREFTFNGQALKPGRKFDPKRLGCAERLLRQLYEQRKLEEDRR